MNLVQSVKTCLQQYATFTGRAGRPEFWWFMLFCFLVSIASSVLGEKANVLATLVLLLPAIAVTARRLHDIDKSGWWQLVSLVPFVGWLIVLYWYVQPTQPQANRFG
ncbi:DUF805 domain-containing protein [Ramlibacter sp. AW1]|uniref:DUF805 domain-containing protein n=1 Tax=Ramlibacter aurantiacus TaxID=2801330 RepID=A0A936ZUE5_9BURK|nr:DUF805 domain-containing protein [Ramlibacter aurantiacus]MBL0422756.1 DUF805 domain-containing protein [Ramlibacter aurantiacus]